MRGHIVHLGLEGVGQSDSPQKVFPSGQKKAERSLWSKTKLQASPSAQLAKGAHERHRAWRGPIPASQPEPPASSVIRRHVGSSKLGSSELVATDIC